MFRRRDVRSQKMILHILIRWLNEYAGFSRKIIYLVLAVFKAKSYRKKDNLKHCHQEDAKGKGRVCLQSDLFRRFSQQFIGNNSFVRMVFHHFPIEPTLFFQHNYSTRYELRNDEQISLEMAVPVSCKDATKNIAHNDFVARNVNI